MATLTIEDIRAGDVVRLTDGQTITVDGITTKYIDRDGEHDGPFVTEARTWAHHPIEDVVEVVTRNERNCRYCGGGVTSTNPDVDYCRGCHYSGRAQHDTFAPLIDKLQAVSGHTWSVWHTGGGCFALAANLDDGDDAPFLMATAEGDAVLPETTAGPWSLGYYAGYEDEGKVTDGLDEQQLLDAVQARGWTS
jgi:hypothetical protein